MKFLFLMGIGFQELLVMLIILTAFGIGIFFLSRLIFRKVLGHLSGRQIYIFSICSALILAPLTFGVLIWVLILLAKREI